MSLAHPQNHLSAERNHWNTCCSIIKRLEIINGPFTGVKMATLLLHIQLRDGFCFEEHKKPAYLPRISTKGLFKNLREGNILASHHLALFSRKRKFRYSYSSCDCKASWGIEFSKLAAHSIGRLPSQLSMWFTATLSNQVKTCICSHQYPFSRGYSNAFNPTELNYAKTFLWKEVRINWSI